MLLLLAALPVLAQQDFSGPWEFNPAKSRNIGMMAQMKLVSTVKQTKRELIITDVSTFNGREQTSETRFDLNGKPVPNKNPMEAAAETVTKWDGNKLVTTWTSPGSIAGTNSVRTETRSLSADGRTMTVESSRGKGPAMVMVYERK
ncbi:MAG TPA: hypothetical protein VGP62_04095 [Bryobacteraceae bacterium]|nr:hypothetical protein [Bryobacteraceae bacterium]